ncbi:MAG: hypothetical protein L3K09_02155 [Thermoplasmata archaeon]|nr:hypothetical protein [Thermoplasmata archaeon]
MPAATSPVAPHPPAPTATSGSAERPALQPVPPPPVYVGRPRDRVDPLVVGLVVGLVLGALAGFFGSSYLLHLSCACPAQLGLEIGVISTGATHTSTFSTYTFNVTNVSNGRPTYGDVSFAFSDAMGRQVPPQSETDWTLRLSGSGSNTTALFDLSNNTWTGLWSVPIRPGQTWAIEATGPVLDGGALTLFGTGSYVGWISEGIA